MTKVRTDFNEPAGEEGTGYSGELPFQPEEWLPHVEEFDISDEKKIELLQMLWNIMGAFVDIGWGIDTLPEFLPALKEFSVHSGTDAVDGNIACPSFNDVAATERKAELK